MSQREKDIEYYSKLIVNRVLNIARLKTLGCYITDEGTVNRPCHSDIEGHVKTNQMRLDEHASTLLSLLTIVEEDDLKHHPDCNTKYRGCAPECELAAKWKREEEDDEH